MKSLKSPKTQTDRIAAILKRRRRIDNYYAIDNKLTYRLAARINDLRNRRWKILTKRNGKNTNYHLIKAV